MELTGVINKMKEKVDRLAELNRQMAAIKTEAEQIKVGLKSRLWKTCGIRKIRP